MRRWLVPTLLLTLPGLCRAQEALFDPEPNHPWNRLHRHLYARPTRDGRIYDHEGLDPVFVPRSRFLTDGDSHRRALTLLDEFLQAKADGRVNDPLRRALLQRDLWAVFVTTADPSLERQPQRRELQKRLAQVMRRVALTPAEITALPDNLAEAVKTQNFPRAYEPTRPERPFLPDDLLRPGGPWVGVRSRLRGDQQAAPSHVEATQGRSAFLILLRLPEGRPATERFLKTLEGVRVGQGETPQIPAGTQVTLLRRMMLIDTAGVLRLTPLTEGLQMRVYRELAAPDMYEFSLRRKDLLAGRAGGLRPTAADETSYFDLGFLGIAPRGRHDPLEMPEREPPQFTPVVMKSCIQCHAGAGIFGFQSLFVDHFDQPPLEATELGSQVAALIDRASKTYAWGLLQGLWETRPSN